MTSEQEAKVDAALYTRKTIRVPRETAATREEIVPPPAHGSEEPLSTGAKEALRWLLSEEASSLTCKRAREHIWMHWGDAVSAELKAFTAASQNDEAQRPIGSARSQAEDAS